MDNKHIAKPQVIQASQVNEFYTEERCFIRELSNSDNNSDLSIALARVEPGITTAWHSLKATSERYLIAEGTGLVELKGLPATTVKAGDLVEIPPECPQRITNTGKSELIFYAVCTPRFISDTYMSKE